MKGKAIWSGPSPCVPTRREAIRQLYAEHEAEIHFWKFCQYEFSLQWTALKAYAGENGIEIMGDIPIYVAADSADVWAAPELFLLYACGAPKEVAGCRRTHFRTQASFGATRCTTGPTTKKPALPGGCGASAMP